MFRIWLSPGAAFALCILAVVVVLGAWPLLVAFIVIVLATALVEKIREVRRGR